MEVRVLILHILRFFGPADLVKIKDKITSRGEYYPVEVIRGEIEELLKRKEILKASGFKYETYKIPDFSEERKKILWSGLLEK